MNNFLSAKHSKPLTAELLEGRTLFAGGLADCEAIHHENIIEEKSLKIACVEELKNKAIDDLENAAAEIKVKEREFNNGSQIYAKLLKENQAAERMLTKIETNNWTLESEINRLTYRLDTILENAATLNELIEDLRNTDPITYKLFQKALNS